MKLKYSFTFIFACFFFQFSFAQKDDTAKYAADVPTSLLTPDKVETDLLGTLEFIDGLPNEGTVNKTYDFLTVSRGVQAFLNGMPAASVYAMLEGLKGAGVKPGDIATFENLMDARTLFLTANSSTPYILGEIDLKNGPVVVEIAQPVLGFVNDAFFHHVADLGITGKDKGAGGKYLFIGPDYEGKIPTGYITVRSRTYRHWMLLRLVSKPEEAKVVMNKFKETFNCYPLSEAINKPKQKFIDLSGQQINTIHANNYEFYNELNAVIQYEPANAFNEELVGVFASIGIKKGNPFAPDQHTKSLLQEAVAIGNASARSLCYRPRDKSAYFYEDRQWYSSFAGGVHDFINNGEMVLDDRIMFHYMATGITPAMAAPAVGTGSVYAFTAHDSKANYLDGSTTYKVTLPAPIPAKDFWSFIVYSNQHRSMLETDQKLAGIDNLNPDVKANKDGSYTIWFGPKAPKGHENNWVQTLPGKGYSVLLRLYGPLEAWFDKSWRPGDFEMVK
ncbi:DUF1254 domain-containing protein [uncultured Algibacter sp.]|uniref:DUF1254 domain-containing protein n=1 Tax=uncultured Algibacter sp. TaxID=298659 RepID=UPI0026317F45|nr:DUF1254 domain-containing protein [uncultured Algibacter sp.]